MDKKTIIGVVLMSVIFIGYMVFNSRQQAEYQQYMEQVQAQEQALAAEQQAEEAAAAELSDSLKQVAADLAAQREKDIFGESLIAAKSGEEQTFTMANALITVDFSTRGGMMTKAVLADYTKYAPKDERNELVSILDPESAMFDMEFYIKKDLKNIQVNTSEYVFTSSGIEKGEGFQRLVMSLEVSAGAFLRYEYVLYDEKSPARDYMLDFNVKLENLSPIMASQSTLGMEWVTKTYQNEKGFKNENLYTTLSYRFPDEDDVEDLGMSEENKSKDVQSEVNWIAFKQQFFSEIFIAHKNFSYADMGFVTAPAGSGFIKTYTARVGVAYNPQVTDYAFSIYCGPNKYAVLSKVRGKDGEKIAMERLIPLGGWLVGWFNRYIVIPVMDFLQKYIGSFGLIILILTVLVKMLILPLTYKSYLSTAKMRVIKPELDALNEKYPRQEDAMKKQQAMMDLYKKAGINPMGGCLPMLIQMPIFIALFNFVPNAIELRQESFLWAHDLSSYDAIISWGTYIWPIGDHLSLFCLLFCVTQILNTYYTSKMQPNMGGSPEMEQQQKMMRWMMYIMPIMFFFMLNEYSSGLNFYYFISTLISVGIYIYLRHAINEDELLKKMEAYAESNKNNPSKKSNMMARIEALQEQQKKLIEERERIKNAKKNKK